MTRIDTLENVINAVHQQSINHFDEIVPVNEMEFDSLNRCGYGRQTGRGGPHGSAAVVQSPAGAVFLPVPVPGGPAGPQPQLLDRTGTPARETFFCRFDANRLRALFTERYTAIDNMEVLTKILENGFDPAVKSNSPWTMK
jgi:hypothetical protein